MIWFEIILFLIVVFSIYWQIELEERLSKIERLFEYGSFQKTLKVVKDELRDAESLKKEMVEMLKDYNKAKKK